MGLGDLIRWLDVNEGTAQVVGPLLALLVSGVSWAGWQLLSDRRKTRSASAEPEPRETKRQVSALRRIESAKVLRAAVLEYPPLMSFTRNGSEISAFGIYPRMLARIAASEGLRIEWSVTKWSEIVEVVDTGKVDVVCSIFWTAKRSEKATICGKMHRIGVAAIVRAEETRLHEHVDLERDDIRIGVVRGEIGWEYAVDVLDLEFNKRLKIQDEFNIGRSVEMLEKDSVDVILADALSCCMACREDFAQKKLMEIFTKDALYVCDNGYLIRRGDAPFQKWIDDHVRALRDDPALVIAEQSDLIGLEHIVRRRRP